MLDIKSAGDEVLRQRVEQFRVGGRVASPNVVYRFDNSPAEQITPEPVDVAQREVGVFRRGHPVRKLLAARRGFSR